MCVNISCCFFKTQFFYARQFRLTSKTVLGNLLIIPHIKRFFVWRRTGLHRPHLTKKCQSQGTSHQLDRSRNHAERTDYPARDQDGLDHLYRGAADKSQGRKITRRILTKCMLTVHRLPSFSAADPLQRFGREWATKRPGPTEVAGPEHLWA